MKGSRLFWFCTVGGLICAGIAGFFIGQSRGTPVTAYVPVDYRVNSTDYKFVNPLLFSRTNKELYVAEFKTLNDTLTQYITNAENTNTASSISVYFRDLNTSDWTGINEDEKYEPSSMLKTVILIAYLKAAESDPGIMSKELNYPGADQSAQYYISKHVLTSGYHTVRELLDAMIIDSDNSALSALYDYDKAGFENVYKDFRLPALPVGDVTDFMSARSFSVIFRSLYNSTYLPWDESESALDLMSKTGFTDGLVAGVPEGTVVAHKFGEHTYAGPDGVLDSRELHDCGVVYYPSHPYLVCVMTKGQDFPKLASVISDISKLVYTYVQSVNEAKK